jgi:hypothetical protein
MRLSYHIGIKRDKKVRVYTSYGQVRETSPQTNKGTDNINLDR